MLCNADYYYTQYVRSTKNFRSMGAPTTLDGALERIKQMMEEIDRKEPEIKRLKTSSTGKIKVLNKYKEENEKRIERGIERRG